MGAATLAARQRASGLDRCAYSGGLAPEVRDRLFVLTSGLKRGAKVGALVLGDAVRNVPGRERRGRGCSGGHLVKCETVCGEEARVAKRLGQRGAACPAMPPQDSGLKPMTFPSSLS